MANIKSSYQVTKVALIKLHKKHQKSPRLL